MIRNTAKASAPSPESKVPTFYRGSDLSRYLKDTMGEDTLTSLGKARNNVERQRVIVEALRKAHPEMNGEAEKEARKLLLNKQELERKEGWFTKLWKAPFRAMGWVGKKMWEHPVLTTIAITLLALYLTGGLSNLLSQLHGSAGYASLRRMMGLDAAAGAARPGMGPGMATPGGGVSPWGPLEDFIPGSPSAPQVPPAPPLGPVT